MDDKQMDLLRNKLQILYGGIFLLKNNKASLKTIEYMEEAMEEIISLLNTVK